MAAKKTCDPLDNFGRTQPAEGKAMELWVKALALEDAAGHRAVILTSDLLGSPQNMHRRICAALKAQYGLAPDQVMLSATHTHCGPVLRDVFYDIYPLDDAQRALIEAYFTKLEGQVIEIIGRALADLAPATLAAGQGSTGFAVNRRNNLEPNVPKLIADGALKPPVDHAVPVLAVVSAGRQAQGHPLQLCLPQHFAPSPAVVR